MVEVSCGNNGYQEGRVFKAMAQLGVTSENNRLILRRRNKKPLLAAMCRRQREQREISAVERPGRLKKLDRYDLPARTHHSSLV